MQDEEEELLDLVRTILRRAVQSPEDRREIMRLMQRFGDLNYNVGFTDGTTHAESVQRPSLW